MLLIKETTQLLYIWVLLRLKRGVLGSKSYNIIKALHIATFSCGQNKAVRSALGLYK